MDDKPEIGAEQATAQAPVPHELVSERVAAVSPEGAHAPKVGIPGAARKSIFLFADGTGNSSAKLFKTNVWRMYEALALGPAKPDEPIQIAYYDNGVGTSTFRPLRLLGGILGIGLKANVLRLYSFLCQNYQKGDKIYVFGFSRGAFTVRLLVGLVASQGIILNKDGQAPPKYQIRDAYRSALKDLRPNRWPVWLSRSARWVRDQLLEEIRITLRHEEFCKLDRHFTDIEFVGVWDTVAAYGGPFAEFTRGIDDWVWPLTLPEFGLSPRVKKARHALSLDDERDAFQPLLWDEHREEFLVEQGARIVVKLNEEGKEIHQVRRARGGRLRQVWFSGVHSDVGGGYPDESLSYISLLWMMDEVSPQKLKKKKVIFIDNFVQRARDLANPYGPIHDSRAGLASYYRYQPRKIAAMMDPAKQCYISLRDPAIGNAIPGLFTAKSRVRALLRAILMDKPFKHRWRRLWHAVAPVLKGPSKQQAEWRKHGLLKRVLVHESAIARIISGIDSYAPAALPKDFKIVPALAIEPRVKPAMSKDDYDRLSEARPGRTQRFERQELAWNLVWARRAIYFVSVAVVVILVLSPIIDRLTGIEALCGDDRCFARRLLEKSALLLPSATEPYWAPYLVKPFTLILGVVVLLALMGVGETLERVFRGRVRAIWHETLQKEQPRKMKSVVAQTKPSWIKSRAASLWRQLWAAVGRGRTLASVLRSTREGRIYQNFLFDVKWRVLPGILGIATLVALLIGGLMVATQTVYAFGEKTQLFCENRSDRSGWPETPAPVPFTTDISCADLGVNVVHGRRYLVRMQQVEGWADGGKATTFPWNLSPWKLKSYSATPVDGVGTSGGILGSAWPFARVTSANFLEPLIEVRLHDSPGRWGTVRAWSLGPDLDIRATNFQPVGDDIYAMTFCPTTDGHLYFMLNDTGLTYGNNSGSATIEVIDLGPADTEGRCEPRE